MLLPLRVVVDHVGTAWSLSLCCHLFLALRRALWKRGGFAIPKVCWKKAQRVRADLSLKCCRKMQPCLQAPDLIENQCVLGRWGLVFQSRLLDWFPASARQRLCECCCWHGGEESSTWLGRWTELLLFPAGGTVVLQGLPGCWWQKHKSQSRAGKRALVSRCWEQPLNNRTLLPLSLGHKHRPEGRAAFMPSPSSQISN